jgi:glycerophosphoryl diester phosphodiesterase
MSDRKRPLIIAHRGFSGKHPENTIEAIEAAIGLGVDMVEIDLQETKDGRLIAFHDFGLKRLCGVRGWVRETTLTQIRALNPAVPTFRQVLNRCRGRTRLLVEIKKANPAMVAAEIAGAGMERDVVVFSLTTKLTAIFAGCSPEVMRAGLIARRLWSTLKTVRATVPVQAVGVNRTLIASRATVDRLHDEGLKVFVWTVDEEAEMAQLADWGVNGLITNWPDKALGVAGNL